MIDIFILLCLGWGAYKGFRRGFIIQSFSIIAVVIGIWCGFTLSGKVEPFLSQYMGELGSSIVSFVFVFILVLALVRVVAFLLTKLANLTALGLLNKLLGAAFGVLLNALMLSLLIVLVDKINVRKNFLSKEQIEKTCLYEPVSRLLPALFPERFFEKPKSILSIPSTLIFS
ncbi:MAG: CvpA family protein [Bacteroidales bacterium]|nr:CvpA family protein [Bacteroidales bacterium]